MATIVYVDSALTTGLDNGTSWADAYRGCAGLQTALSNVVNLSDTIIYIRNTFNVGSYGSTISITKGGDYTNNRWLKIIGCDSAVGNPLPDGQYVTIDGENTLAGHILHINNASMVHIENIHFTRANTNGCYMGGTNLRFGYNFINCKFSYCNYGLLSSTMNNRNVCIVGCVFFNNNSYDFYATTNIPIIIGNFFNSACSAIYASYGAFLQDCLFNCLSDSGTVVTINAGLAQQGEAIITRNTFYCTGIGEIITISCNNFTGPVITNNIIYFAQPTAGYPISSPRISFEDYNCTNATVHTLTGIHSLNGINPQFVNAAGGDFRPRNPAVLRGGQPDVAGNLTEIGVIQSQYKFISKARAANFGRRSIFK